MLAILILQVVLFNFCDLVSRAALIPVEMSRTYVLEQQMGQLLNRLNMTMDPIPPEPENYTSLYILGPILIIGLIWALACLYRNCKQLNELQKSSFHNIEHVRV